MYCMLIICVPGDAHKVDMLTLCFDTLESYVLFADVGCSISWPLFFPIVLPPGSGVWLSVVPGKVCILEDEAARGRSTLNL